MFPAQPGARARDEISSRSANPMLRSTCSSVAFAHYEVQTAQHSGHVAHHATREKLGQDAEIDKRWRANFQPVRHAATLAVDVKAQLAFWILCREVNFAGRRVESFSHNNEMMDQLFHLRHDV